MKKMLLLSSLISFFLLGCNDLSDQVEVRTEPEAYWNIWSDSYRYRHYLTVTSLSSEVIKIDHISVNRDACPVKIYNGSSTLESYSSKVKYEIYNCTTDDVREVQINMNGDDYVFSF